MYFADELEQQVEEELKFQVSQEKLIKKCAKCTFDLINHAGKMKCINNNCR